MTPSELRADPYVEGYLDGLRADTPEPGPNRDPRYRHSFEVARAERAGRPIPAETSRLRAAALDRELGERPNDPL